MGNVLTVVSADTDQLGQSQIDQLASLLAAGGAQLGPIRWLSETKACDIFFDGISPDTADPLVRAQLDEQHLDGYAQPDTNRAKKIFVADMDSTIVSGETLDDLAELAGVGEKIAEITARAMNGELPFREALKARMAMLKDLPTSYLDETLAALKFNPGAEVLLATLNANGTYTALVSGGFRFFTEKVSEKLGFVYHQGNILDIENGKLTGKIVDPIVTKDTKLEVLNTLCNERGVSLSDSLTVGDGANDLPMLKAAGLGVAYRAKPVVRAEARAQVTYTDLSTLLYYQGYTKSQFVQSP